MLRTAHTISIIRTGLLFACLEGVFRVKPCRHCHKQSISIPQTNIFKKFINKHYICYSPFLFLSRYIYYSSSPAPFAEFFGESDAFAAAAAADAAAAAAAEDEGGGQDIDTGAENEILHTTMPPSTPPPPPPPPPLPTEYEEDPYTFLDDDQASAEEHTPAGRIFIPTTTAAPADTAAEGGVGDNERVFNTVPECETSVLYGFKAPAEAKRGKSRNYIATVYLADALNEHSLLSLSESCAFYCNAKSINPDPLSPVGEL